MKRILVAAGLGSSLAACAGAPAQERPASPTVSAASVTGEQTIEGELVDLTCYLDHGARGEHHKSCATSCALKGLPIGLLGKDDTITLVVGAHERPMNSELADRMGTMVQLTGKIVSRNGMRMIEVSGVR
jgi:hypothetical protein